MVRLSSGKLEKLSDISISVGQVFFASVFIEPLIGGEFNWSNILAGFILSVIFWLISLVIIS